MIEGDVQISEPAMNLPPIQLGNDLETNFSTEDAGIKTAIANEISDNSEIKNHFARLKRRMRSHSSNIF